MSTIEPIIYRADSVGARSECKLCGGVTEYRHVPELPAFMAGGQIHVATNTKLCPTPTALQDARAAALAPHRRPPRALDDPFERAVSDYTVLPPQRTTTAATQARPSRTTDERNTVQ